MVVRIVRCLAEKTSYSADHTPDTFSSVSEAGLINLLQDTDDVASQHVTFAPFRLIQPKRHAHEHLVGTLLANISTRAHVFDRDPPEARIGLEILGKAQYIALARTDCCARWSVIAQTFVPRTYLSTAPSRSPTASMISDKWAASQISIAAA
jgi:hypothetical protein